MRISCSSRSRVPVVSSSDCFSWFLTSRFALTVSASLSGSTMPATVTSSSGGILRLSLTYFSKSSLTERRSASVSRPPGSGPGGIAAGRAVRCVAASAICSSRTRSSPSTRILTVLSGSLSTCRISARTPTS